MLIGPKYTDVVFLTSPKYTDAAVTDDQGFSDNAAMAYGNRIKQFRKAKSLTQAQLADAVGVEQPTVQRWEAEKREPRAADFERMADVLGVSVADFFDGSTVSSAKLGPQLFVKGAVAAGLFRDAVEIPEYEWEPFTGRADLRVPASLRFGLRVQGDSMNLAYLPGTIIECQSIIFDELDEPIPSGKRVIVERKRFGDGVETTVKELYRDDGGVEWLVPKSSNPVYQAFRCDDPGPDFEYVRIIAIVVGSYQPE